MNQRPAICRNSRLSVQVEKGNGHGSIEVVSLEQAHVDLDAELTLNREQWRAKETKIAELKDASLQLFVLDS